MADEELQNDEINLDDFNFDDLSDVTENETPVDGQPADNADDIDLGDFSFDNFDFGEMSSDNSENGVRKEPFFETPQSEDEIQTAEDEAEQDTPFFPEETTETETADAEENISDIPVSEETETVAENTAGETDFSETAEGEEHFDGVESVSSEPENNEADFSVDDYLMSEDETEIPAAEETIVDEVPVDETADLEVAEEGVSEAGFMDEIPEETPLDDEVSFSEEEAKEAHEEYFSSEEPVADDTDIFAGIESEPSGTEAGNYSAVSSIEESTDAGYARWYSGQSDLKMFEISKGFESGNFDADEECKTLHINVGYDTYGWEVQFSDGVVMNLRDVREYQIRNGRLPNPDGRIIYGHSSLLFSGLERIVVYESVKYFSYGI